MAENPAKRSSATRGIKPARSTVIFQIIGYLLILLIALVCLLPFLILISGSFTSEAMIEAEGFSLFPKELSVQAYTLLFRNPGSILQAYGITTLITATGTLLGLFLTSMTAYVMSRRDFKYRNTLSFYFYFTTLFSGGMVSTYIFIIRYLHLKDNLLSLILPLLINVFYLLIMRSFMSAIPVSIIESAKVDGAGEFRVFLQLVLPLAKSGLATIGLYIALDYWNDWYNAMLYINSKEKFPLQYLLYNMLSTTEALSRLSSVAHTRLQNLPSESLKMAMAVIATGPVILVYPFVQKYFIKGITVGAVKG